MFYKRNIENLKKAIFVLRKDMYDNVNEKDIEIECLSKQLKSQEDNAEKLRQLIEGHDKLLQQLIPTINKQTQKYKKLEENYQMLVKVVEKIATKIDPEWKSKTVNINKAKKGK